MRLFLSAAFAAVTALTTPIFAQDRVALGVGRFMNNDIFGDMKDRWHTGSAVISALRGPKDTLAFGPKFGDLIEFRLAGGILTPASITAPVAGDRPYAGFLSLGLHTHFTQGPLEGSVGVDVVATGPQTGMDQLQGRLHGLMDVRGPSNTVIAGQVADKFYPTALIEVARPVRINDRLSFRPFLEAQAGVENFARIGGDLLWGSGWGQGIYLRDTTSGQLYRATPAHPSNGVSLGLGADVAHVISSAYLPASDGYQLTPYRSRARLGIHLQGEGISVFYGVTWLGREFVAQPEGQVIGAIRVGLQF